MADIREAVPAGMQTFWDMTISAYWAWSCWDAREGQFHSAQGAGGLGFGFPAAIGGAVGTGNHGQVRRFGPGAGRLRRRLGDVLHLRARHREAAQRPGHLADRGRRRLRHPARIHGRRLRQGHGHRAGPARLRQARRGLRRPGRPGRPRGRRGRAQGRASPRTGPTSSWSKRCSRCSAPPTWPPKQACRPSAGKRHHHSTPRQQRPTARTAGSAPHREGRTRRSAFAV